MSRGRKRTRQELLVLSYKLQFLVTVGGKLLTAEQGEEDEKKGSVGRQ